MVANNKKNNYVLSYYNRDLVEGMDAECYTVTVTVDH